MLPAHDRLGSPYTILLTSLTGLFGVQITFAVRAIGPSRPFQLVVSLASTAAVFALQLCFSAPRAEHWSARRRNAVFLSQAVATYLPEAAFGVVWIGMTGFLAGSALLLIPGRKAWVPFTAIALSTFPEAAMTHQGTSSAACIALGGPATGILVYGLSQLVLLIRHAQSMHSEVAQLAVIRERARFARDLHDLLGYSLSAIALKADLSRRVIDSKPDLARDELTEVVVFARQAVADVRQVANGYRTMSLAEEARSAASLLAAAYIKADIEIDCGPLDTKVDTTLATILREAATNLLRHSAAQTCRITASRAGESVTLTVANDGAPRSGPACRAGGGLENLMARLESIGGTLTVESQDGLFVLSAGVPQITRKAADTAGPEP